MKRIISRKLLEHKAAILLASNTERLENAVYRLNKRLSCYFPPEDFSDVDTNILRAIAAAILKHDIPRNSSIRSSIRIGIISILSSLSYVPDWPAIDPNIIEELDLFLLQNLKSSSAIIRENTVDLILCWPRQGPYIPTYFVEEIKLYVLLIVDRMKNNISLRECYLSAAEALIANE